MFFILSLSYLFSVVLLAISGLHRLNLLWGSAPSESPTQSPDLGLEDGLWPEILVQVPLFNEGRAVFPLLQCLKAQNYPQGKFFIQVLDDSTDGHEQVTQNIIQELFGTGGNIQLLHRTQRHGFKAGALKVGLSVTKQPLVAMFDADFRPAPDFLRISAQSLQNHPEWACVQTRWGHLNRDQNALTRAQAMALDGHFLGQQQGRFCQGGPVTFNGTAGVWRRQAIQDAGGWRGDTLTEDMDLSLRVHLGGGQLGFLSNVVVPAELPDHWGAFKTQQSRWSRGSMQVFRLLGRALLAKGPASWRTRKEIFFQLTENMNYIFLFLLILLSIPTFAFGPWDLKPWAAGVGALALGEFWLYHALIARRAGRPWSTIPLDLLLLSFTAIALAPGQSQSVLRGLTGKKAVFVRTPKSACPSADKPQGLAIGLKRILACSFLALGITVLIFLLPWVGFWGWPFFVLYAVGLTWSVWFPPLPRQPTSGAKKTSSEASGPSP